MIKFMKSMNLPALTNLISYMEGKMNYLMEKLSTIDDVSYLVNNIDEL